MNTPKKAIHRNADFWQSHINTCRSSGLTQTDYCRERGLAISTFHRWQKKLRESGQADHTEPAPADLFIEWPMESLEQKESGSSEKPWDIELSLGHSVILRMRQS